MMIVEPAVKNLYSGVGEGPHWDGRHKQLLSVDLPNKMIAKLDVDTGTFETVTVPGDGHVTLVIPATSGGYVITKGPQIKLFDWETRETRLLDDVTRLNPDAMFNDGKCDAKGRLFAGTVKSGPPASQWNETPPPGGLYVLNSSHKLEQRSRGNCFSNGLAWSSDNRYLFHVDTFNFQIHMFDYDIITGDTSNQRVALDLRDLIKEHPGSTTVEIFGQPAGTWFPDGCCMDVQDKLWLACPYGSFVIRIDLETGKLLEKVDIPGLRVTSCCFGGTNLDELYVTTAREISASDTTPTHPLDGTLFRVRGLPTRGVPVAMFEG